MVWARCPCVRPRWPFLLLLFRRRLSQFHIPPRWGSSKGGFKGKGGRGTKGVLPFSTAPCHAFLPKAETKSEVVEAACPTNSAEAYTAWFALSKAPSPPPSLYLRPCHRSCADQTTALQVLEEYKEVGAVEGVSQQGTQFLSCLGL